MHVIRSDYFNIYFYTETMKTNPYLLPKRPTAASIFVDNMKQQMTRNHSEDVGLRFSESSLLSLQNKMAK
jgi:hypothetical protein